MIGYLTIVPVMIKTQYFDKLSKKLHISGINKVYLAY